MPIGYLVTTALMAAVALLAVSRHRPRRSSPFRLSYVFGFVLNWPLVAFVLLVASTVLAVAQSGVGSPVFWIGLGFAVLASAGLVVLRQRAQGTSAALERALERAWEPAGATAWTPISPLGSATGPPSPASCSRRSLSAATVERIATSATAPRAGEPARPLSRSRQSSGPPNAHLPARRSLPLRQQAFRSTSPALSARRQGWVCVSANYRLLSEATLADPLIDVKKVIAWVREHGREYGLDPDRVPRGKFRGGHLASLAALPPAIWCSSPVSRARTWVAGVITLYGYYGPVGSDQPPSSRLAYSTTNAPPCFVVHGDQDTLVTSKTHKGSSNSYAPYRPTRSSTRSCPARNTGSTCSAPCASTQSSMRSRHSAPTSNLDTPPAGRSR